MVDFLRNHFQGIPDGWITLWAKNNATGESRTAWYNLQDEQWAEKLQADALKADAAGWDCYFSTCPGSKKKSARERIKADEVIWIPAFFMDIDSKTGSKADAQVPENIEAAVDLVHGLEFQPSAIINSGNGIHAYMKLDNPIKVSFPEVLQLVTKQMRAFAETASKALGNFPDLDTSASEPARVLRIPGTHNHKREPLPVTVIELTGQTYPLNTLTSWAGAIEQKPPNQSQQPGRKYTLSSERGSRFILPGVISEGGRNNTLHKYGLSLRSYGATDQEVETALYAANRDRCRPSLPESEVRTIIRSVCSKPPGNELRRKVSIMREDFPADKLTLDDLHPESNERYNWSDIGNGRLFADWYKGTARFVPERKCWFIYNGKAWEPDLGDLAAMKLCKRLADNLARYAIKLPDEKTKLAYLDFVKKWQRRAYRETILKDARDSYPIKITAFDADPYLFNCLNGTLDLRTGKFHEHRPEDLLSKVSGVNYDPTAKSDRWERFIDEVMQGDEEKAAFLQKALGYALTGDTRHECFFILYGPTSRNGKGTTMETYLRLLGDYGATAVPDTIAQQYKPNGGGPSEDVARLVGARFVNMSEPDKKMVLSAAKVKQMTGNDTITARFLHENSFEYRPEFKLFINTNYLPQVTDITLFVSGRVKVIPFERHFTESEQDRGLKAELAKPENLSGILNWCIQGLRLIDSEGFDAPGSVLAATDDYRMNSDKISRFLDEEMETDPLAETRSAEVYARYKQWCELNGYRPENAANFKTLLSNAGEIKRKRPAAGGGMTTMFIGYKLTPENPGFIRVENATPWEELQHCSSL